jgi:hypothetical protein
MFQVLENNVRDKWIAARRKAEPDCFIYIIPNAPMGGYRPFDVIACIRAVAHAIEFKVHKLKRPFDVKTDVRPHQLYELEKFKKAGGISMVVYYDEPNEKTVEIWL